MQRSTGSTIATNAANGTRASAPWTRMDSAAIDHRVREAPLAALGILKGHIHSALQNDCRWPVAGKCPGYDSKWLGVHLDQL